MAGRGGGRGVGGDNVIAGGSAAVGRLGCFGTNLCFMGLNVHRNLIPFIEGAGRGGWGEWGGWRGLWRASGRGGGCQEVGGGSYLSRDALSKHSAHR